jgi:hypothetical protein
MQMGFVEFARYRPRSNQPTGLIKNALINEVQTSRDDVDDGKEGTVVRPNWSVRKTSIKIDVEIRRTDYPSLLKPLTDNLVGMSHVDKGQLCMKMQGVAK